MGDAHAAALQCLSTKRSSCALCLCIMPGLSFKAYTCSNASLLSNLLRSGGLNPAKHRSQQSAQPSVTAKHCSTSRNECPGRRSALQLARFVPQSHWLVHMRELYTLVRIARLVPQNCSVRQHTQAPEGKPGHATSLALSNHNQYDT